MKKNHSWAILIANPHCLFWRVNYYFFGYISIIQCGFPFYRNPMKSTNLYIYMHVCDIPIIFPFYIPMIPQKTSINFQMKTPHGNSEMSCPPGGSGYVRGPLHRRHRLLHLLQSLPLGFRQRLRHRGRDATWFFLHGEMVDLMFKHGGFCVWKMEIKHWKNGGIMETWW